MGIILRSKKIYFKTQFDVANIDGDRRPGPNYYIDWRKVDFWRKAEFWRKIDVNDVR